MKKGRTFYRLFSFVAIFTLILIMAVASTFSWYNPTVYPTSEVINNGNALNYDIEGKINRISGLQFKTYEGTVVDGMLIYNDASFLRGPQSVTIRETDEVAYYKTIIMNDDNGAAMVSLYVNSISCTDGDAYVGISKPEKTYVKSNEGAFCIEDNLIVPNNDFIEVYWYVGAKKGATITFGDLFIAYN